MSTSCLILGFRFDSARRANACARSAVNARVRIDDVNVALADRADRALADAGAASNTRIMNYICHVKSSSTKFTPSTAEAVTKLS